MAVREGYKQSEVGVIPEDWEVSAWGEILECFSGGATPYRAIKSYYNGCIKWITSGELKYNIIYDTLEHISEEARIRTNLKIHPAGTFLMAITGLEAEGTRGSCGIVGSEATTNQSCLAIYGTEKLLVEYLYHYYLKYGNDLAFKYCQGTKQQSYTAKIVKQLPICYPKSTKKQKAIATALSDIDGLINSLKKLIEKKKNLKQGAMQELLKPEVGWLQITIGETATLKARIGWQGLTTAEYKNNGDYYLITGTDFINGYIDWKNCHYVDKKRFNQDRNIQVNDNDVLVTKDGTIGKTAFINALPKPATLNSGVFVIRPVKKSFHPQYFYYVMMSKAFSDFLAQLTAGSTITHLYQKDFVNFSFHIPHTIEEQTSIANILSDMDSEIETLQAKLNKYKAIKQGMMQELLTGRIRLLEGA